MKVLVTGACGFVGSTLLRGWKEQSSRHHFYGVDSLVRPGSERNRLDLRRLGITVHHADLRCASDFEGLPPVDVVIDAAAQPSVLAGADGQTSSRQVVEHNLVGTLNMLEYCRQHGSGFVLLSTSRVYSIAQLARLPIQDNGEAFELVSGSILPSGMSARGVTEAFSTMPPVSLYGATKSASERLALEYGELFGFQVWVDRCGVLAGAGQFGRPDQGIFTYWLNSWLRRRPLRYIGFGGNGYQVRDCLHPLDLIPLLDKQLVASDNGLPRVINVSGGLESSRSLHQLSQWCRERLGEHSVDAVQGTRQFDVPWVVLDASVASQAWGWRPARSTDEILEEILEHAKGNPDWLEVSAQA